MIDVPLQAPCVSIIVPAFNEAGTIAHCLRSIVRQDYPPDLMEILIVDAGSSDSTRDIVAQFQAQYRNIFLLHNPDRIVSPAMNRGVQRASGQVIVRIDAHCVVEPDYVRQCVRYLQITGADNVGGLMRPIGQGYVGAAIARTMSSPLAVGDAKFRYATKIQKADTVYMGAFRRDVFDRIGLYNESLARNQDYELNYRIRAAGGQVYLVPAIRSHYVSRPTLKAFWSQYFDYGFWKAQMLKQHPRSARLRQLAPPSLVLALTLTGLLAQWWRWARWAFGLIASAYSILAGTFAWTAARESGWRYLPIFPITFATMHLSWGTGFIVGLLRRPSGQSGAGASSETHQ